MNDSSSRLRKTRLRGFPSRIFGPCRYLLVALLASVGLLVSEGPVQASFASDGLGVGSNQMTLVGLVNGGATTQFRAVLSSAELAFPSGVTGVLREGQIEFRALLDEAGDFTVATGEFSNEPPIDLVIPGDPQLSLRAKIQPVGTGTGALPLEGGSSRFTLPARIDLLAGPGSPELDLGSSCSIDNVTFDLAGSANWIAGELSLGSKEIGLGPVTGCGPLAESINEGLGLGGSSKGEFNGDFFLEDVPDATPARLSTPRVSAPRSIRAGKSAIFSFRTVNSGQQPATQIRICLRRPVGLVAGPETVCRRFDRLGPGRFLTAQFRVKFRKGKCRKRPTRKPGSATVRVARFEVSAEYLSSRGRVVVRTGHVTMVKRSPPKQCKRPSSVKPPCPGCGSNGGGPGG